MNFHNLWWNISVSTLVILAVSSVFEISCEKNRQTDRQTDRQTPVKTVPPWAYRTSA